MSFTSDLIHPSSPSSTSTSQLPSGLITFVSSSDRKTYAVWTEETSETFCSWFATTKWYQNAQADGATYSLPSWTSSTKTVKELWTNFNQIALVLTREGLSQNITITISSSMRWSAKDIDYKSRPFPPLV